jgi:2-keto-4-pentenoate hydratase
VADVGNAVDAVCAAIELVDDRQCDYSELDVLSLISDNSWNAGIVHGPFAKRWSELSELEGIVFANGAEIGRGFGRDALGHPLIPLAWLANELVDAGGFLRAGEIVMTGSLIKTRFPLINTQYRFVVTGLREVCCRVNV